MKSTQLKLLLFSFLLLLGKSIFDIHYFSVLFNTYNSNSDLVLLLSQSSIIGLTAIIIYNFLQRSLLYRITILYNYFILIFSIGLFFLKNTLPYNKEIEFLLAGLIIASNFVIILSQKGIISRLHGSKDKLFEKHTNVGSSLGLIVGGLILLYLKDFIGNFFGPNAIIYIACVSILFSSIFIARLFQTNRQLNYLQDNLQVIKVNHQFYKLVFRKYFFAILILMTLAVSAISSSYAFFIKTNIIRYHSTNEFANLLSIVILVYSIISIAYEFFFKDRLTYTLNMKVNLQLLPIILLIFSLVFILNSWFFKINSEHEFFFFVSIFAVLFIIFTQFVFINIFYPAINRLYLPLDSEYSNDFFIKSSFYGIFIGIGFGALLNSIILSNFKISEEVNYIVATVIITFTILPIIRFGVYSNYRKALHNRLNIESQTEFSQESFIKRIMSNPNRFKGPEWIRVINLVQLINPIKAKIILKQLTLSDDTVTQRIGIIGAIKYYLLSIYEDVLKISKTKYYPSSPNRDKIDELIQKFTEVEKKMLKHNYISQLSISKKANERLHSSLIIEHASYEDQKKIIKRLINDTSSLVTKSAIIAAENINNKPIIKSTIEKLGDNKTANAAFSTLVETEDKYLDLLEESFNSTGQKEIVQIRIIQILGRIATEKSVDVLIKKLNHTNQNIVSEALTSLSNCNIELPENKKYTVLQELEETCKFIVWNTQYLIDLKQFNASKEIIKALKAELTDNYGRMYNLLSLLYNPGSIELIRKNLNSNKVDKITFALELATVILKDELKPMIIPMLRPLNHEQRIQKLNTKFITESLDFEQILYDIIQRDTKWVNAWTKACAIVELQQIKDNTHSEILLSNILNPDALIAELSAATLKKVNKTIYKQNIKVLKDTLIKIIGEKSFEYINKQTHKERDLPIIKYEIINYFQSLDEFKNIPGEILKEITYKINAIKLEPNEVLYRSNHYEMQPFFYIVYNGELELKLNGTRADKYSKNSFINSLDYFIDYKAEIEIKSITQTVLYEIETYDFITKLNNFDIIPSSIIDQYLTERIQKNHQLLMNERNFKLAIKNKMLSS